MSVNAAQVIYYINSALFLCMTYYGFVCIFKPAVKTRWIILAYATYLVLASEQFFAFNNLWWNLLFNIIALSLISLLFSGNLRIRIIFAILMYIISMAADVIPYAGLNYIYYDQYKTDMPDIFIFSVGRTITNVIYLPILLICILGFRRYIAGKAIRIHFIVPKKYTIAVLLMLAGIIVIDVLFCAIAVKEIQKEANQIITSQFIVLIVVFLIIWFYNAILDYLDELEKSRLKDQMLERWETQYRTAISSQQVIADLTHNLRYTFLTLSGFLKCGDIEGAENHLQKELGEIDYIVTTGNMPIDTMINYYRQRTKEVLKIELKIDLAIPPNLDLDAGLIVTILGNALENAIEACEKVEPSQQYIHVKARLNKKEENSELFIIITNPYIDTPIEDQDGNLITIKKDKINHGLGLASIMEVLPEEVGRINYDYNNGTFRFMLLIWNASILDNATDNAMPNMLFADHL